VALVILPMELPLPARTTDMTEASALIDPLNKWSLWVPLLLLICIVVAAIYFVRASLR
jgi:hypothetical protein